MEMNIPFEFWYLAVALIVVYSSRRFLRHSNKRREARSKVSRKQKTVREIRSNLEKKLTTKEGLLDDKRRKIVELPFKELQSRLQDGRLSCLEVLQAYQAKALEVTHEFNCVTEFIKEAEEWAKKLDEDGGMNGKKGPLHGIPFSVKDNCSITGYDNTVGITRNIEKPASIDAPLVAALKKLGAIPFCKTNVPQTMLSIGCSNPIWGSTRNPHDKERTPGGSSGGEGCLVAAGGSPFGLGSDVAGSIRIPASFCGIPCIKPTNFRLSYKGFVAAAMGCVGVKPSPGIVARDVDTIVLLSRLLLADNYHHHHSDPDTVPIPWNEQCFAPGRKLRIGYYDDDGFFPTTPGVRRAVRLARERLQSLGHELVPFSPPRVGQVISSFISILGADRGRYILETVSTDDIDSVLKLYLFGLKTPYFVKVLTSPIVKLVSPRLALCFMASGGYRLRSSHQLWMEIGRQNDYKQEFLGQWRQLGLDLCIAPSYPGPAPRFQDMGSLQASFSYTALYNYLDLPVGTYPVTVETEEDQMKLDEEYQDKDLLCKVLKRSTKGATGLPICLQIAGLPYQEEKVLHGLQILDSALSRK